MAEPLPVAYLNGEFLPLEQARISPLDRGFLFADGIYEVIPAYAGRLFRFDEHLRRLERSLAEIRLANPFDAEGWRSLLEELIRRNGGATQSVYLQVTRGADRGRDHVLPGTIRPTVFAMASRLEPVPEEVREGGIAAVVREDIRWKRCDIKSVALLPNILLRDDAIRAGAGEAILVNDGHVIEGTSSTLFLVRDGVVYTPPPGNQLLPGITRDVILELAREAGIPAREQALPREWLQDADEIWLASSTREVVAVTRLDGRPVGDGRPGPVWRQVDALIQDYKARLDTGAATA
jgi:D-alanine transaminase